MAAPLDDCHWPTLAVPYDEALRQAIAFVLMRFNVKGIIASGTIIRGNPDSTSDLDIYVINQNQQRQRIQRRFHSFPAEIFINPVSAIRGYFETETKTARPLTAHMLATGFVILDQDSVIEELRAEARRILADGPQPNPVKLRFMRYGAATLLEDAVDVLEKAPASANLIFTRAVYQMLHFAFLKANRWLPRDKDLINTTLELNPQLGTMTKAFFEAAATEQKHQLARQIADLTIETHGFFEWESSLEEI
jgi:predicted nucleotidyltransferase